VAVAYEDCPDDELAGLSTALIGVPGEMKMPFSRLLYEHPTATIERSTR